ncbi:hypothetical protein F2Q70_00011756 [Brassica cretica]|uniref:Uncharacterized protein n=1 Tax=Brassica cretica TaxID=69181 RepID=A0A8S9M2P5_BRACR|nr:hypothetical protein F2Q70_00011756 [Brassica cretica]
MTRLLQLPASRFPPPGSRSLPPASRSLSPGLGPASGFRLPGRGHNLCGAQEKNEGDFQMKLDGLYYLLNDSISWLTTCMEEMRQDIAKIQTQLGKIARFRYVLKYDKFRLSYVNHEKVSIDNSIRTSIDTPFKISIDRTIAASIDASSRKLYGQV